jgi:hypothetical protein
MKKLLIVPFLLLAGCSQTEPEKTLATSNPQFEVDVIGKVDGCTIYRFRDSGRPHYFVKCADGAAQTMTNQNCGKNCQYQDHIPTVTTR